eukprot:scaffold319629_cov36-Tisochrysis_lutea.AAC.2
MGRCGKCAGVSRGSPVDPMLSGKFPVWPIVARLPLLRRADPLRRGAEWLGRSIFGDASKARPCMTAGGSKDAV